MPTLHLILGVVNYLYKNMVEEAQAACEGYSIEYLEAEREWERAKYDAAEAKTNKNTFEATNGQYERQLKRDLRIEADEELQHLMEADLELLEAERFQLKMEDELAKGKLRERRKLFDTEGSKPENSKLEGQTVRAGMESIMKDYGIDFGSFQGGDIQGNGCRKIMSCGGQITKTIKDFLQSMPAGQKNCDDQEIGELFDLYARLLGHLDAFFCILRKKRFHLEDSDLEKASRHRDAIGNLWRYLKMSITPKLHLLFGHLLGFLEQVQGFGDLGEDAGERAHQEESRNESRVGAVANLVKKERTKSQFEAMKKSTNVKQMMSDLKDKSRRKFKIDGPSRAEENGTERKRVREEERDSLLLMPLLDGTRLLLSDIKRRKILNG